MTDEEAADKRRAAFHEAGHMTVALAYDVFASDAIISKRHDNGRWDGEAVYDEVSGRGHCVFGMAGATAEWWAADLREERREDLAAAIESGEIESMASEGDKLCCPSAGARARAIHRGFELLVKHRDFLDWAANQLMTHHKITGRCAKVQFASLYPTAWLEVPGDDA